MNSFENKVIWITGASSGIGEALVCEFAKRKSKIVLSSRNEKELERVFKKANLNESSGLILTLDLSETINISHCYHFFREFTVYGNEIYISYTTYDTFKEIYYVYDLNGKLVREIQIPEPNIDNQHLITIDNNKAYIRSNETIFTIQ